MSELDAFYDAHPEPYQESEEVQDREVSLLKSLVAEQDTRERRRLFFAAMRHPEMRMIRLALDVLKRDEYLDWRTIEHLDVSPWYQSGCWGVEINQFFVYHFLPTRDTASVTRDDLSVVDLHWDDLPEGASCGCFLCEKARNEQAAA